jgi:hypothetical protein
MMQRRRSAGKAIAVGMSLAVHGALLGAWLAQRTPALFTEPPAVEVWLIPPVAREEPRPEPAAAAPPSEAAPPAAVLPRPTTAESPGALPPPAFQAAPGADAPMGDSGKRPVVSGEVRAALAARLGCRDPQTAEERARCAERIAAAPEVRLAETRPYFRMREHVAVMAEVRRRENTGYRLSCESMRNLTAYCPNFLPENLPEDFELPKD